MSDRFDMATVVIISALALLALIGIAVLLLIVVHQRRIRHQADVVGMHLKHAQEMHQVEREVENQTLDAVGRDLHDNVGHLLTALNIQIRAQVPTGIPSANAQYIHVTLDHAITELRRLSKSLNSEHLRKRPLVEMVEEECQRLHLPGKREVVLMANMRDATVTPDQHVVFYRIFQEAMSNALKHASAGRITVTLVQNGALRMAIQDDGIGYDPRALKPGGQGLDNIRRRAALIGATCTLLSEPGKGTTVIVSQ